MKNNFMSILKSKKKVMKLSMIALAGAVTVCTGAALGDVHAMLPGKDGASLSQDAEVNLSQQQNAEEGFYQTWVQPIVDFFSSWFGSSSDKIGAQDAAVDVVWNSMSPEDKLKAVDEEVKEFVLVNTEDEVVDSSRSQVALSVSEGEVPAALVTEKEADFQEAGIVSQKSIEVELAAEKEEQVEEDDAQKDRMSLMTAKEKSEVLEKVVKIFTEKAYVLKCKILYYKSSGYRSFGLEMIENYVSDEIYVKEKFKKREDDLKSIQAELDTILASLRKLRTKNEDEQHVWYKETIRKLDGLLAQMEEIEKPIDNVQALISKAQVESKARNANMQPGIIDEEIAERKKKREEEAEKKVPSEIESVRSRLRKVTTSPNVPAFKSAVAETGVQQTDFRGVLKKAKF